MASSALAQIAIRKRIEAQAPERLTIRMWLFPGLSYATLAAILVVLAAMAVTPDLTSQFLSSLLVTALFLAIFMLFRRGKGVPIASILEV